MNIRPDHSSFAPGPAASLSVCVARKRDLRGLSLVAAPCMALESASPQVRRSAWRGGMLSWFCSNGSSNVKFCPVNDQPGSSLWSTRRIYNNWATGARHETPSGGHSGR